MNPVEVSKRIETLDYLRGFALLGIILVNILPLLSVIPPVPHTPDASYQRFLYLFVEGRFYTIFAFLFGVGFYLFLSRAYKKRGNGYLLFFRRLAVLLVFGLIHLHFHPGEALTVYAICGLVILPFYRAPKGVNLFLGVFLLAIFAAFSIKLFMTLPLMLLGISAGQYRVFEDISFKTNKLFIFTGTLLLCSMFLLMYQAKLAPAVLWEGNIKVTQHFLDIGVTVGPIVSAFYTGLFVLLLRFPIVKKLLVPLKYYGRMALTNYLLQTALLILTGTLFKLAHHITYIQSLFACIAICLVQLTFSTIWLQYFRFGPMEWIWRMLTYKTIIPIKVNQ